MAVDQVLVWPVPKNQWGLVEAAFETGVNVRWTPRSRPAATRRPYGTRASCLAYSPPSAPHRSQSAEGAVHGELRESRRRRVVLEFAPSAVVVGLLNQGSLVEPGAETGVLIWLAYPPPLLHKCVVDQELSPPRCRRRCFPRDPDVAPVTDLRRPVSSLEAVLTGYLGSHILLIDCH